MSESTAVTVQDPEPKRKALTLADQLQRYAARVQILMPPGVDARRMLALTLNAVQMDETGNLAKADVKTLVMAVCRLAQMGLEPGVTGHFLSFFNKEKGAYDVTPCPDYRGYIQMMIDAGARDVDAQVVRKGDRFEVIRGLHPDLIHVPAPVRGEITHAYCVVTLPGRILKFEVMSAEEIEVVRTKSKSWKKEKVAILPEWYARKTVIRRAAKYVAIHGDRAARLRAALQYDGVVEEIDLPNAETLESLPAGEPLPQLVAAPTHQPLDFSQPDTDFGAPAVKNSEVGKPSPVTDVWANMDPSHVFDPSE